MKNCEREPPLSIEQSKNDLSALVTNIQGFSTEDGPGIRTTVFFKGCPLRCPWCHNPEGLTAAQELVFFQDRCIGCGTCKESCERGAPVPGGPEAEKCIKCFLCVDACPPAARQVMGQWYTVGELFEQVMRDRVYYETSGGGVTASGGEPLLWGHFLAELFRMLKNENVHTALDTSAAIGEDRLQRVLENTDLVLLDLKVMDPEKHREIVGVELPPVIEHIRMIDAFGVPIIIRVPVVPGYTDSEENLLSMAEFASGLESLQKIELLPYHRMAEPKYAQLGKPYTLAHIERPSDEHMEWGRDVFVKKKINAVIGGRD